MRRRAHTLQRKHQRATWMQRLIQQTNAQQDVYTRVEAYVQPATGVKRGLLHLLRVRQERTMHSKELRKPQRA